MPVDKTEILNVACFLLDFGANLSIKNKKQQTPTDLCSDLEINKILIKKFGENINKNNSKNKNLDINIEEFETKNQQANNLVLIKNQKEVLNECMICSENKRDVIFKPCNHIVSCFLCANRCKKCLICKEAILEIIQIDECIVCCDRKASYLFQPCGHMCACEVCAILMKKCVKCRIQIEKKISFLQCCGTTLPKGIMNDGCGDEISSPSKHLNSNTSPNEMLKLQQQLQDIKEQVTIYIKK